MIKLSHPNGTLKGSIELPGSKSISNRLLMLRALYHPKLSIEGLSEARDTQIMQKALRHTDQIQAMDAGTVLRFCSAYAATRPSTSIISGTERLHQRPMSALIKALRSLGAEIECLDKEGFAPLRIKGGFLKAKALDVREVDSSQFVSALIMILPLLGPKASLQINKNGPSFAFVQLTISLMHKLGYTSKWQEDVLSIDLPKDAPASFAVEKDWTSFYYWFTMACLAKEADLFFPGLMSSNIQSEQDWLAHFVSPLIRIEYTANGLRLRRKAGRIEYNQSNLALGQHPDLAPTFALLLASLKQEVSMHGLEWLKAKESDRELAISHQLQLVNSSLLYENNQWILDGRKFNLVPNQQFASFDDHRMAMSVAPLALLKPIAIESEEVVKKSYPNFWKQMEQLGFEVSLSTE